MIEENKEEYLEAIYSLEEQGTPATTSEIAGKLNVSPASVTEMLKKLDGDGFLKYSPYKGAELTRKGERHARKIKRKHRLLERFLHDVLGIGKAKVHPEACRLEHGLSDESADALDRLMDHPVECPDDRKPIPGVASNVSELRLLKVKPGNSVKVLKIGGGSGLQSNLKNMGIREGKMVKVIAREPAGGPLVIKIDNMKITLGRGMASKILVGT